MVYLVTAGWLTTLYYPLWTFNVSVIVLTVGWTYYSLIVTYPGTFTGTDLVVVLLSTIGSLFTLSV